MELFHRKDVRKNKKHDSVDRIERVDFICGLQMVGKNMRF